jgi:hypothetical protein
VGNDDDVSFLGDVANDVADQRAEVFAGRHLPDGCGKRRLSAGRASQARRHSRSPFSAGFSDTIQNARDQ